MYMGSTNNQYSAEEIVENNQKGPFSAAANQLLDAFLSSSGINDEEYTRGLKLAIDQHFPEREDT